MMNLFCFVKKSLKSSSFSRLFLFTPLNIKREKPLIFLEINGFLRFCYLTLRLSNGKICHRTVGRWLKTQNNVLAWHTAFYQFFGNANFCIVFH